MTNALILQCWREQPFATDMLEGGVKWTNIGGLYRMDVQALTPGQEAAYGLQFLYSTLSVDPTLTSLAPGGVWRGVADAGVATPFVIISLQSGLDVLTATMVRVMSQPLFQCKAVGEAKITAQVVAAASQIDVLLKRVSGSV